MSKSVVICEKPSVGKDISRVLGCRMVGRSHAENNKYIVTWAFGHLVTLKTFDGYKEDVKMIESLPLIPKYFKLEAIKQTSKQYFHIRKLLERNDVNEVIIATDAGREGELVARWILDFANCKKPIKRLWISSVTDKAIKDGFKHLKPGKAYENLYHSAKARAKADWIVGLNGTKALMLKHNASLSMGRVQTPAVGIIQSREQEITGFVPKKIYSINCLLSGINLHLNTKDGSGRLYKKEIADTIMKDIKKALKDGKVILSSYATKTKKSYPNGLYDLTLLQRDANKRYGFSAKETLNIMQSLYERHKVLTYPRTDSKYLTADIVPTLVDRVKACRHGQYKEAVGEILKQPIKANKSFVDDSKVTDHHGIIPTEEPPHLNDFSPKEMKIYNLVVTKFLAALLPPAVYEEVKIEVAVKGEKQPITLSGRGRILVDPGYERVYSQKTSSLDDDNANQDVLIKDRNLIAINEKSVNNSVTLDNIQLKEGKTSPKKRLTEGELLYEMEKKGLGTVATRADIIEKIQNNRYIEKVENRLRITKTGKQLLDLVPDKIKTSDLTAKWEKDLKSIEKGQKSEKDFLTEISQFTREIIQEIKTSESTFKHDNVTSEKCPDCGKQLLRIENKYGKKLVCQDRECGYKKNLSKATNARCPECHKKLELVGEKDKQTFVCKCGYKESMSAFNKRKSEKKGQMSKRDVRKYMNKAQQEESINNPFANLLKDFDKK